MSQSNAETSVLVSLRELVALEDERLREEQIAREQAQREADRARREAEAMAREAERARQDAEEAARREAAQRLAEERARIEAIEAAEVERARVAAAAEAERAVVASRNAHERELRALDEERSRHRLRYGAGIAALLALSLGVVAAVTTLREPPPTSDPRVAQLEAEQQRLFGERLAALDRFGARLAADAPDPLTADLAAADAKVRSARSALDPAALADAKLDAYEEALGAFGADLAAYKRGRRAAALRALHAELETALAALRRRSPTLDAATEAAERARVGSDPDDAALDAYDAALDELALLVASSRSSTPGVAARPVGSSTTTSSKPSVGEGTICTDPHDPLCGKLP